MREKDSEKYILRSICMSRYTISYRNTQIDSGEGMPNME